MQYANAAHCQMKNVTSNSPSQSTQTAQSNPLKRRELGNWTILCHMKSISALQKSCLGCPRVSSFANLEHKLHIYTQVEDSGQLPANLHARYLPTYLQTPYTRFTRVWKVRTYVRTYIRAGWLLHLCVSWTMCGDMI